MDADVTRARVAEVLSAVLGCEVPSDRNIERRNLREWDSVKAIEVVFALEDVFEVRFSEALIPTLTSVDAIVSAVELLRAP